MSFEIFRTIKELRPGMVCTGRTAAPTLLLALVLTAGPVAAGKLGVDVDVGVSIGGGGVGVGVDADVGVGGASVGASVGVGTGGTTTPGDPGVPGVPGVVDPKAPVSVATTGRVKQLTCAKDGNETAYNGFVVRDRDGAMIGWVHEAPVSPSGKVLAVRMQSTGSACYKLANAGFRISGDEVWANVDGTSFR
jgi:hypothetical protein